MNNNKTRAFEVTADNKDTTNTGHRMINLGLVISEKAARIVIGKTPFQDITRLTNAPEC